MTRMHVPALALALTLAAFVSGSDSVADPPASPRRGVHWPQEIILGVSTSRAWDAFTRPIEIVRWHGGKAEGGASVGETLRWNARPGATSIDADWAEFHVVAAAWGSLLVGWWDLPGGTPDERLLAAKTQTLVRFEALGSERTRVSSIHTGFPPNAPAWDALYERFGAFDRDVFPRLRTAYPLPDRSEEQLAIRAFLAAVSGVWVPAPEVPANNSPYGRLEVESGRLNAGKLNGWATVRGRRTLPDGTAIDRWWFLWEDRELGSWRGTAYSSGDPATWDVVLRKDGTFEWGEAGFGARCSGGSLVISPPDAQGRLHQYEGFGCVGHGSTWIRAPK